MAHTSGTVASFTVDRLAYSPSPPTVFAVVDFDGGGRVPLELTDVDADEVHVGMRVVPTFRRLYTADDIHNYFWKARPLRDDMLPAAHHPETACELARHHRPCGRHRHGLHPLRRALGQPPSTT